MSDSYKLIREFLDLQLGEDWREDYEDPWQAAEDWISTSPRESLKALNQEILRLFSETSAPSERWDHFQPNQFRRDLGGFDCYLCDVQGRLIGILTGVVNESLREPNPYPYGVAF